MKSTTPSTGSRALRALADRVAAERRRVEERRLRDSRLVAADERDARFTRPAVVPPHEPAT